MAVKKILPEIQKDSIGIALTFQTGTPLTDTTSMKLVLKVGSTIIEKLLNESHISNPATGEVVYTTVEDDLAIVGRYKGQIIDTTAGVYLPSKPFEFEVKANVE